MESLYFLIPIAFVLLIIAIRLLSWAIKSGQYDDLDTEAHRILFDDTPHQPYRGSVAPPAAVPATEEQVSASDSAVAEQQSSEQPPSEQPPSKS